LLGYGGFGVVFRAFDPELMRHVAVKLPRPDVFARHDARRRFLDEARVVAMLRHPGIVQVHDTGSVGPLVFIASELCSGETLRDWMMARQGRIAPTLAARIVMQLSDAVAYAHARGVIHQDLKPGNVLIDGPHDRDDAMPRSLRITDFGLACRQSTQDSRAEALAGGTRRYMAPEQRSGDVSQIGTHIDVYALGVILIELLQAMGDVNGKVIESTNVPASREKVALPKHRGSVPRDLWAIFLKCTQPDPANRYSHAGALYADLQRYLDRKPVSSRRIGVVERTLLSFRRRPLVASLITMLVVGATVALSMILREWERAETNYALAVEKTRLADQRLREAESLLVRMSWALDESFFWSDSAYTFDSDFRRDLARDMDALILTRPDSQSASLPAIAATQWRRGYEAYERNDFAAGEQLAKQSLATWQKTLQQQPNNRVFRRSAALTLYYLTIYGFSAGKDAEQLLALENRQLIPNFSWDSEVDLQLADDLAKVLEWRAKAIEDLPNFPSARAAYFSAGMLWKQLAEHQPTVEHYQLGFARTHGLMGECDRADHNYSRAKTELIQAIELLTKLRSRLVPSTEARMLMIQFRDSCAACMMRLDEQNLAIRMLEEALVEIRDVDPSNEMETVRKRIESRLASARDKTSADR
jgi:serine/threonine protein kinase